MIGRTRGAAKPASLTVDHFALIVTLRRGARSMEYDDEFYKKTPNWPGPRPFQSELVSKVLARKREGKSLTVGLAGAGTGKTLGYQATGIELLRENLIDAIAVYSPRTSLARQCELVYREQRKLFDPRCRFDKILHKINTPPLTTSGLRMGFTSTTSALVADPATHLKWAAEHAKRFLLVGDEAQFFGCEDEDRGINGTAAAANFKAMSEYAAHTLLLTATELRSDGKQIVLADYQQREDGQKYIEWHVKATYGDGVGQGYLREFDARIIDAEVIRRSIIDGTASVSQLSEDSRGLTDVLRCPQVWQPAIDAVVMELKIAKQLWPGYKAMIAFLGQNEARQGIEYIRKKYPEISYAVSLSDDGAEAQKVLTRFREDNTDLLATVRMAYIGFDCNRISIVGILTNYRDLGHLEQLAGRGFRVDRGSGIPPKAQRCILVVTDDPGMNKFLSYLKDQLERGIKPPGPPGPAPPEPVQYVESAEANSARGVGMESTFTPAELAAIERYRLEKGIAGPPTNIALIMDKDQGDCEIIATNHQHQHQVLTICIPSLNRLG
jgi:hypothetical protein